MKYIVQKNWLETFDLLKKNSIILLPFILIAFFEILILEFIFFSSRYPIVLVAGPVIKKFFGEGFLHYPSNILVIPKIFYYLQVALYISIGVFLNALALNIFKNVKEKLPIKAKALVKNASKNILSFVIYGVMIVIVITLIRKADIFLYAKSLRLISKVIPQIPANLDYVGFTLVLFFTNLIGQVFFISAIPYMVLEKKPLWKAVASSIATGFKSFIPLFKLVFLPFIIYLPIVFLKSFAPQIANTTFPEAVVLILIIGSMVSVFIDSFVALCVGQFIIDKGSSVRAGKK